MFFMSVRDTDLEHLGTFSLRWTKCTKKHFCDDCEPYISSFYWSIGFVIISQREADFVLWGAISQLWTLLTKTPSSFIFRRIWEFQSLSMRGRPLNNHTITHSVVTSNILVHTPYCTIELKKFLTSKPPWSY